MPPFPRLLIVSGNGRNSGKTTLITRIIREFREKQHITGIKISPHFHPVPESYPLLQRAENWALYREDGKARATDSARMLHAGAREVFYVQAYDQGIPGALDALRNHIDRESLWVCESGGLPQFVKPGILVLTSLKGRHGEKPAFRDLINHADIVTQFDGRHFTPNPLSKLKPQKNQWVAR